MNKDVKASNTKASLYCHPTSCCLGNAFEVLLENPPHCHGSYIQKVLKTHVINATGGQDHRGACCQNLLDPLLGDIRFPGANKSNVRFSFTTYI